MANHDTRLTANSFVDLCRAEKIKITLNNATHQAFLANAGHADPSVLRAASALERALCSLSLGA